MQADVEAHGIGKLDRAHRHAELLGGAIDRRERHAFAGREHRFGQVRHQHAIDEEARRAAARQRQLVDAAGEGERRGLRLGVRSIARR